MNQENLNVCKNVYMYRKKLHWLSSLPPQVLKAECTKKSQMNVKTKNISHKSIFKL